MKKYLFIIIAFAYLLMAVPFLLTDSISWDLAGHLHVIESYKDNFPNLFYFEDTFFLGYEQFSSYPPLFYWIAGLFSFVIGSEWSLKLLLTFFWILTPISIYYFSRLYLDQEKSYLSTILSSIIIVGVNQHIGGNFLSTFIIGNITHAVALPLALFAIYFMVKKRFFVSLILISLVSLTHIIIAITLGIAILCYTFYDKNYVFNLLGFGLASFWLIPFFFSINADIFTHDDYFLGIFELILFLSFLTLYYFYSKENDEITPIYYFLLVIFSLIAVNRFLFPIVWMELPLHYHRLKLISYLFFVVGALSLISRIKSFKINHNIVTVLFVILILSLSWYNFIPSDYEEKKLDLQGERIFTVEKLHPDGLNPHNFRYELAENNYVMKGLFVEATPHSSMILSLERAISNDPVFRWGVPYIYDFASLNESKVKEILYSLGVSKIVSDHDLDIGDHKIENEYFIYSLNGELISIPDNVLFVDPSSYSNLRPAWINNPNYAFVKISGIVPEDFGFEAEINFTKRDSSYYVTVNSEDGMVPVLLNFEYNDKFRAFNNAGEIPVFEVYPDRALVFAGEDFVVTKNNFNFYNYLGFFMTLVGIILLIILRWHSDLFQK